MTPPTHYHHYVKVSIYPKIKNIPTKIALRICNLGGGVMTPPYSGVWNSVR